MTNKGAPIKHEASTERDYDATWDRMCLISYYARLMVGLRYKSREMEKGMAAFPIHRLLMLLLLLLLLLILSM